MYLHTTKDRKFVFAITNNILDTASWILSKVRIFTGLFLTKLHFVIYVQFLLNKKCNFIQEHTNISISNCKYERHGYATFDEMIDDETI